MAKSTDKKIMVLIGLIILYLLLKYVIPYWKYAVLNVISNLFSVLFSLASLAVFLPIINMLFSAEAFPASAPEIVYSDFDTLKENAYYYSGQLIEKYGALDTLMYISFMILGLYK